jgi:hypothetical protein
MFSQEEARQSRPFFRSKRLADEYDATQEQGEVIGLYLTTKTAPFEGKKRRSDDQMGPGYFRGA